MKPTEIKPLGRSVTHGELPPDRLTPVLIWTAFFLIAGLAAIVTDLWLRPISDGPVAEALAPAPLVTASPGSPLLATAPGAEAPAPAISTTTGSTSPTPLTIATASPSPPTPPACIPPADWGIHVVQAGNTLYSLANRYGTYVDILMRVNCLNTHTIFIGQRLYVPGPAANPTGPASQTTNLLSPTRTPQLGATTTPPAAMPAAATPLPTLTPLAEFPLNIPDHYLNIVLLGSDRRPQSSAWRTDSMIVVSVDATNNVIRLLSIPRDLWVYIPGHGYDRINTADLWGEMAQPGSGPDRVKQTIHRNLGIPVHHYVRLDFQGFIKIIDLVGGIDVDVDCPLPDIDLSAGLHHMTGQQALRYARSRKSTSDFDRARRQRKVLMALWDQSLTLDIVPQLPELWWTMANAFQTDLSLEQVINLAYVGVQLEPQRILSRAIGPQQVQSWVTPQGAAVLLPRHQEIRAMLEGFYAAVDITQLDAVHKLRVRVLNGSQRRDAEQLAASALRWAGFNIASTGLAEHQDYAQTQIAVYTGEMAAAEQVARELEVSSPIQDLTGLQEQPDPADPADIQVILGLDYNPCQR
jgi:LCP family protein required for cell wall assembly